MPQQNKKFINMLITNGAAIVSVLSFKSIVANEPDLMIESEKQKTTFVNSPNFFAPRNNLNYILEENKKSSSKNKSVQQAQSAPNPDTDIQKKKNYISAGAATFMLLACIRKKLNLNNSKQHQLSLSKTEAIKSPLVSKFKK